MRIGIDARPALRRSTGVGRYVTGLVRGLARLEDPPHISVFASSWRSRFPSTAWPGGVKVVEWRCPSRVLDACWRTLRRPRFESLVGHVDLVHSPSPVRVPSRLPSVVTVHDLFFFKRPDLVDAAGGRRFVRAVARELRAAQAVIAVSDYTRREVRRLLGLEGIRIQVVHSGLESHWHEPLDEYSRLRTLARHALSRPFVLAVGRAEPRKNLGAALRALARIGHKDLPLVVTGPVGPASDTLAEEARRLGIQLMLMGHVSDVTLKALYRSARALVFPSLDEGFGFPLLEAMASGLPVVASDAGAIPEVAGTAAALAPTGDEALFADLLGEVLDSAERAEHLRKRGLERARSFSWDATAKATCQVYAGVLGP
jgi:glycosyltransferase involved in cell wall biosynthesis